ncbi:Probable chromosome-partitioning protein parB [Aedoeadaptatus ivorii]|uniref:Probable chromosome-partitioning protein parB n=1 Tax=Aedoeadaptatus ivorii TaxID=54006 RepID=A0A3S4YQN6_9FIRM|nr:ParB/RepB/Spo0J family partition protein [Peptoniphilus ivorii]VEJ36380.1 Probable chromosome-partitioning protein parB [Peptoniphilus ivorii]
MEKKRGLGRGLDNFFNTVPLDSKEPDTLPITEIRPNPEQPRKRFGEEGIKELARSIEAVGVLQPLLVQREGEEIRLIAGERRLRAAKRAGLEDVPVRFIDVNEEEQDRISLIENIQREDLNPMEEAEGYEALRKKYGYTQEQLANLVGKSRPYVANSMRLMKLEPAVQEMLRNRDLTISQGKLLLGIKDGREQIKRAQKMIREQQTIEQSRKEAPREQKISPYYRSIEEQLMDRLGTKAQLKGNGKKGRLVIEYYSGDDLSRIVEMIMGGELDD